MDREGQKELRTPQEGIPLREAYPIKEAVVLLGVSRATLYRMQGRGEIAFVEVGGRPKVTQQEIERVLSAGGRGPVASNPQGGAA